MRRKYETAVPVAASLLGILAVVGCEVPRTEVFPSFQVSPDLSRERPREIAVLPVVDKTKDGSAGQLVERMRASINQQLVWREYTPLRSRFVDASFGERPAGEASITSPDVLSKLAGRCKESAILAVELSRWDDSQLQTDGSVRFYADVNLFSSKSKKSLWSGAVEGTIKAGGRRPAPRDPQRRAESAAQEFAELLITRLPRR